jgi:hypothetical protein
MNASEISNSVARQLSELWQFHRMPDFPSYVLTTYKVAVSDKPAFERIYIAEAENGDIESATIGGIIKHWWMRNEFGFQLIRRPELCDEEDNTFDLRPIVKFYIDNGKIIGNRSASFCRLGAAAGCLIP